MSERKEAEDFLERTEERLKEAIRAGWVGLWDWDLRTNQVYFSAEWKRQIGYEDHEIGNDFSEWQSRVHPDDLERTLQAVHAFIAAPYHGYNVEFRFRHKDGSYRWILAQAALHCDAQGKPVRMLGTHIDITQRKQIEEALRASEARLRNLFEQASDGIFLISTDNRYLEANARGQEMLGYTRDELLQMGVADVLAPHEVARLAVEPPRMMSGIPHLAEWEHMRKDSSTFVGEVSAHRLDDDSYLTIVRDLTERKRAEKALWESNEKLRLFVHYAPSAIAMFDRDMRYIAFSHRWLADYGLCEQELAGRSHYDIFPDLPERWKAIHQRGLAGAVEKCDEDPFPRTDGFIDWVRWEMHPWRTRDGNIGGIIIFSEVITERKQLEKALQENEERLRMAVQAGNVGLWDWDLRSNQVFFSSEWKRQIGYADHEITNDFTEWESRVHPDDLERTLKTVQAYIDQPHPNYSVEFRFRHKDGSYRWILAQAALHFDAQGKPARMLGSHIDITASKQAEEALRGSEESFRSLFENMLDGVAYCRMIFDDGDRPADFVYLKVNSSFERLTGLKNVVGKKETEVFQEVKELHPEMFEIFGRVALTGKPEQFEIDFKPLKQVFFLSVYSMEKGHFILTFDNITERKQAEQEILKLNVELEQRVAERTSQLEVLNRELETFAYSVSHDLKAPLRGIDGYSKLLLEDCAAALSDDCRLFVDNIRQGARQMSTLIEDLLAYSRMERRVLQHTPLDLTGLAQSLVAERAEEIEALGAEVRLALPPMVVRADRDGMATVLRNLLGNALKFSRDARPPVIEIGGREGDNSCILWIQDNGIGFDMKFHDRIFEIFQRLQRVEDYPGTGIGLALVSKAMQRMGGKVWAESMPGQGATFYLELPKCPGN